MVKNKVILITGASQGLGKELSQKLGKLGAKIALIARKENLLRKVKTVIVKNGGKAEYFICDVTNKNELDETVKQVVKIFGTIDILFNGAGIRNE